MIVFLQIQRVNDGCESARSHLSAGGFELYAVAELFILGELVFRGSSGTRLLFSGIFPLMGAKR